MKKLGKWFNANMITTLAIVAGVVYITVKFKDSIVSFLGQHPFLDFNGKFSPKAVAEQQLQAMWGLGTNEDELFNSLKNLTKAQLKQVYKSFGTYAYEGWGKWASGADIDLFGWYKQELSGDDLQKMREIWSKTDLTLTF